MFRGLLLEKDGDSPHIATVKDLDEHALPEGDTTVDVEYSTVNYKDGLAIVNGAPVVRLAVGAGHRLRGVPQSTRASHVVLNGWGVGESAGVGLAQKARVPSEWLVELPADRQRQAAAIGTAGYTAMLCVLALEEHHVVPASGPVLVTGAAGGVGSVAVAVLAKLGYEVHAVDRPCRRGGLPPRARCVRDRARDELNGPVRAARARDDGPARSTQSVGVMLANIMSMTKDNGCVAACGNAGGMDLPASVAPFILRGVTLAGVNSVTVPHERRVAGVAAAGDRSRPGQARRDDDGRAARRRDSGCERILDGTVRGRVVVDVNAYDRIARLGKVAIVTGASRGVGAAAADCARPKQGCARGVRGAVDRCCTQSRCRALSTRWSSRSAPRAATRWRCRPTWRARTTSCAMVARTVEHFGRLDLLVNNAAITFVGDLTMPTKRYDLMMAVNVRAPFIAIREAAPHLRAAGGGVDRQRLVGRRVDAGARHGGLWHVEAGARTRHARRGA